jgi:phage gpG-like protein
MASVDFELAGHQGFDPGAKITNGLRRAMNSFALTYLDDLKTGRLSGNPIKRRTGNLARDWTTSVTETPVGIVATVKTQGAANAYAGLQEYGGTIRPKNGKWLWIPTRENQTAAGVARTTPRQAIQHGGFIAKGMYFGRSGKTITPLFSLKKSVTVQGRMGAGQLWERSLPRLESVVSALLQDCV